MKWFFNLKIGVKLLSGFILVALIAGAIGVFGIVNMRTLEKESTDMYEVNTVPIGDIGQVAEAFQRVGVSLRDLLLTDNMDERKQDVEKVNEYEKILDESLKAFEGTIKTQEIRNQFNSLKAAMDKYEQVEDEVTNLAEQNKTAEAAGILRTNSALASSVSDAIDKLVDMKTSQAKTRAENNTATSTRTQWIMIILVAVGVMLAVVIGILISRMISNPVRKLAAAADKLSVGDINVNIEATTKDEIGTLMSSFSKMIASIREQALVAERMAAGDLTVQVSVRSENDILGKNLKEMVNRNNEILMNINNAADQVAAGAKQVSDSSQGLSQGTTEQASSVEEITSSITEIAAQTKQNAVNASQANELAVAAKENAISGNSQMQEMLKAMVEINDASANISKIIKVIDEIAFQTNILALNAAVEAARAGQHGKGFAVVAEEVRNLAARSANAAKETTDLIEGSIKKVEAGTNIANGTADALVKIVDGASKAAELVAEIASASNEQATGISQVNQAINQVSQVVQMSTATAEESASASEELASQAELLKNLVSQFKLKKNVSGYSGIEGLNPEIMRVIEQMMGKKVMAESLNNERQQAGADIPVEPKIRIALDDREFGKY